MKKATQCVQCGWQPKNGDPRVLPIFQSTTFKYDDSNAMARLFDLEEDGYFYTRLANPTNDAVAKKIAALTTTYDLQGRPAIEKKGVIVGTNQKKIVK